MPTLLDINNIAFTVIGYPMSYIEFFGVLFNLACVLLVARQKVITWPIGIIGSLLFIALFWQIQLYSDAILNVYFVVTGFMGWYAWTRVDKDPSPDDYPEYFYSPTRSIVSTALKVLILSLAWGLFMRHAHTLLPWLFTQPASFPVWDGAILIASFAAQWLMVKRRVECWVYWILVDMVAIVLYWVKDVKFLSILYMVFLGMAIFGLIKWHKTSKTIIPL